MKKFAVVFFVIMFSLFCVSCSAGGDAGDAAAAKAEAETQISYEFADREEGIALLKSNTEYYENFSQNDLNYRLQKEGGTLEEWLDFAEKQVVEFSDEEKEGIDRAMEDIEGILAENGYTLPELEEVKLVKTTMAEECDAGAYTHGTQIYIGETLLEGAVSEDESFFQYFTWVMCHELFHCMTRSDAQFREDMYGIIGFTVQEEDFEISDTVLDVLISNPDVEHRNSYATFTINGEKKDCFTVMIAEPFAEGRTSFFDTMNTGLVPIDDLDTLYTKEDASDFWEVFGENTDYVIDPEECLADNFANALVYGKTAPSGEAFKNPEIIDAILAYMKE